MTTSATSLPKVCAGGDKGGVGGNGRPREGTRAGEEGEGNDDDAHRCCSPKFLVTTGGGVCSPHTALFPLIYPPVIGGIADEGAGVSPTRRPPFNFIYPPRWGVFFLASSTTTGATCGLHAAPILFSFLLPLVGELLSRGRRGGV